jgi:TetR/AcrR family transcriptional repressor of nem operon
MARQKKYIESEVIEKAMHLFWRNGYETTSVRMLEKEMGINQFSMYASFGNKQGVFIESIKCYQKKARVELIEKLKNSTNGTNAIKQYFYDFIEFSKELNNNKGCLLTNTINELGEQADPKIVSEIIEFATKVRVAFVEKLKFDSLKNKEIIEEQANYLMVALQGLSVASKMFQPKQLEDFIKGTFKNL